MSGTSSAIISLTSVPELTVDTPEDWQVLQRDTTTGLRTVQIEGSATQSWDTIRAKLEVRSEKNWGTAVPWTEIDSHANGPGAFSGQLEDVEPGWYTLTIEAVSGTTVARSTVDLRVGNMLLGFGQSLFANSTPTPTVAEEWISCFSLANGWARGSDPQPDSTQTGGSLWPALAALLAEEYQMPIGFADVARGGVALDYYSDGSEGWEDYLGPILEALGKDNFLCVLLEQGQSGPLVEATYITVGEAIIDNARATLSWPDLPFLIAQSTWESGSTLADVRSAQLALQGYDDCFAGPDTDTLNASYRQGDNTHFTNAGAQAQAALWAEKITDAFPP